MSSNSIDKKVIYISWVKLTDKYAKDYFIEHLIEKGVEVEFWDIVELTREQHTEIGELETNYLRVLKSYGEFEELLAQKVNANAIFVMLINLHWSVRSIYQILSTHKCKTVFFSWGYMPLTNTSVWQRAASKLIKMPIQFLKMLRDEALLHCFKKLGLIRPFDTVFTAGSRCNEADQFSENKVQVNYVDYDHYLLANKKTRRFYEKKYAVFLDTNLPFHSDLVLNNTRRVNPIKYYESLNGFFDLVEARYNVEIIIAAHPKTDPATKAFGNRKLFRLGTAEIVKDAEFVITHHSTSLSYAVLNRKPCIFIYTSEMVNLYRNNLVRATISFAEFLDASSYNIDDLDRIGNLQIKPVNQACYNKFKYDFITSVASENSFSKDIFFQHIDRM